MSKTTNCYKVGKLLLFSPSRTVRDKSLPKGFYVVVMNKFPNMLLCPIPKTELLRSENGEYIVYKYSAARNPAFIRSEFNLKIDESLIPKNVLI